MPFDITKFDSQTIIFGGLTLVSISMIWVFARVIRDMSKKHFETDKLFFNHTNEVIQRNSEAMLENSRSNQKLTDMIERWHESIVDYSKKK